VATKCTWLFNGSSSGSGRVWGFSESWYTTLAGNALLAAMDLVSSRRVQILSVNSAIVGYRIGQDNGRSFVKRKLFFPPDGNSASNLPVDCALCQVDVSNSTTRKKFFLHDLPDDWIIRTVVDPMRIPAILLVVNTLAAAGFQVRYQNQTAITAPVLSVDATGNVVTSAGFGIVANQTISFLNCRDINHRAIRGNYIVETVTDSTHFKVAHWGGTVVGRSGRVRLVNFSFGNAVALGDDSLIGAASRKVGRPFFQSRGRAPVRR
jgi:hypothetical protein